MAIDKEALYGKFDRSKERKSKLSDEIIRKALDIPTDDDVNITTNNYTAPRRSLPATILAGIGLASLLGVAAMIATTLTVNMSKPTAPIVEQLNPIQDWKVQFYNKNKEPVILPSYE